MQISREISRKCIIGIQQFDKEWCSAVISACDRHFCVELRRQENSNLPFTIFNSVTNGYTGKRGRTCWGTMRRAQTSINRLRER